MKPARSDRIKGALWGLLVGDALGVPYEFHDPRDIPPAESIEPTPPSGFPRAHAGVPPGTWSDDGAHALCLLASLLHCERLDVEDLMRRLTNWYEVGYLAVDGNVFDVGVTTAQALAAFRHGAPAAQAGSTEQEANGNGSLMRVLPLALWHRGTDAELAADAALQSRVTHAHPRAQVCCALYCLWARRILEGGSDPWRQAVDTLRRAYADDSAERSELEFHIRPDEEPRGAGTGYVVDCLRSARLAGLRDGYEAIPKRWCDALREPELAQPLIRQLVERAAKFD